MSKIIQLRHRIKAIDTIKKITHAMRLISMSTHSHLKHIQKPLTSYSHELETLFAQLTSYAPKWHNPIIQPDPKTKKQSVLLIVVGTQKGLCGSFNTNLFKLFTQKVKDISYKKQQIDIIAVGQKIVDFARAQQIGQLKHSYEKFTTQRIVSIPQEITHTLVHAQPMYNSVLIFSNLFRSFFVQKPHITTLIPVVTNSKAEGTEGGDLLWEEKPTEILDGMIPQYLASQIQYLLFQSLLSEHAARFISMDSATRNADGLLEATQLEYNKLRQAKITKELAELAGSYMQQ